MLSATAHTFQVIVEEHQSHLVAEKQAKILTHSAPPRALYFRKIHMPAIRNWCIKDPTYVTFTAKPRETANGTLKLVILSELWCRLLITHRKWWHKKPSDSINSTWPGLCMSSDVWGTQLHLVHLIKTLGIISRQEELELVSLLIFSFSSISKNLFPWVQPWGMRQTTIKIHERLIQSGRDSERMCWSISWNIANNNSQHLINASGGAWNCAECSVCLNQFHPFNNPMR